MSMHDSQQSTLSEPDVDLLTELAEGEDDFDVDLMACGCRLSDAPTLTQWGISALGFAMAATGAWLARRRAGPTPRDVEEAIRQKDLDRDGIERLAVAIADDFDIERSKLHQLAERHAPLGVLQRPAEATDTSELLAAYELRTPQLISLTHALVEMAKVSPSRFRELLDASAA